MTEDEKRIAWIILEEEYPTGETATCPICKHPFVLEQMKKQLYSTKGLDGLEGLLLTGYKCPDCGATILGKVSNK